MTNTALTWKYKWVKIAQIAHYEMVRPLTAFYSDSFHGSLYCRPNHRNRNFVLEIHKNIHTLNRPNRHSQQDISLVTNDQCTLFLIRQVLSMSLSLAFPRWFDQTFKVIFFTIIKTQAKGHLLMLTAKQKVQADVYTV